VRLGDVCSIKARIGWQGLKKSEYLNFGDYCLVSGTDFDNGFINWETCSYVNEWRYNQDANIQLQNGDVLVTKDGTIGKVAFVKGMVRPTTLNSGVFVIRPINGELLPTFLQLVFKSHYFSDFLDRITAGSTIVHLYQKDIVDFDFPIPDVDTQLQIVKSISAIDDSIEVQQFRAAKYEAIKKATVNLLLEPKDEWRIVPLGEICEVCSTRRVHESDWTDLGVPFYRARELVALNEGRSITPLHISENLYKELIASSGAIRPGDLLVTGVGSIGVPYLVKRDDKFYFKDGNIIWFKNRGEILPDYFLHAFRSDHIQKQIIEMACVGTVGSYTITNGKRTLIALPPLDEQKRIVAILDSIDGTISGLKSQLAKAQDIKQGMMSYFFG